MARVNVEQMVFTDARYAALGKLIGCDKWSALGRMTAVWNICQERGSYVLAIENLNFLFDDCPDFATALLKSGLGKAHRHGVYISGTKGRIEWLVKKRVTAKKNGASGGRPAKTKDEPTKNQDRFPSESLTTLALALSPAPALTPASAKEEKQKSKAAARTTAEGRVEGFELTDGLRMWAAKLAPSVPVETDTEKWRDHCRENGYRNKTGPIQDAAASWRKWIGNSEMWGSYKSETGKRKPPTELVAITVQSTDEIYAGLENEK